MELFFFLEFLYFMVWFINLYEAQRLNNTVRSNEICEDFVNKSDFFAFNPKAMAMP